MEKGHFNEMMKNADWKELYRIAHGKCMCTSKLLKENEKCLHCWAAKQIKQK